MALQWWTDRGLQLRMALALVLVLPVAFVCAFVFLLNTVGVELLSFATERRCGGARRTVAGRRGRRLPWKGRRAPLDDPEPFTLEFGPAAVGEAIVLGGSGEVRGYWQSQLSR
jgi:hypothetical protein